MRNKSTFSIANPFMRDEFLDEDGQKRRKKPGEGVVDGVPGRNRHDICRVKPSPVIAGRVSMRWFVGFGWGARSTHIRLRRDQRFRTENQRFCST